MRRDLVADSHVMRGAAQEEGTGRAEVADLVALGLRAIAEVEMRAEARGGEALLHARAVGKPPRAESYRAEVPGECKTKYAIAPVESPLPVPRLGRERVGGE